MVTMFEMQVAQGADTLMPGYWYVEDEDARVLVMPQDPIQPDGAPAVAAHTFLVVLLNKQGHVLAQCNWAAKPTENFVEPIRVLRDWDIPHELVVRMVHSGVLRYGAASQR